MPELPEVQTTVVGLRTTVVGLTISDVWTDLNSNDKRHSESLKNRAYFAAFKKQVVGQKITAIDRRAKNILVHLKNHSVILVHMKMTGHLLYGMYDYDKKQNIWIPHEKEKNTALRDPFNKYLRVVFSFSNNKHLAFSDLRKFGKITLLHADTLHETKHLKNIGPEPLEKTFTRKIFTAQLLKRPNGKIKQVLMDQSIIAGVGNIYSDEALWLSGIHPLSRVQAIPAAVLKKLYKNIRVVLQKGIHFGGDSTSDYRNVHGKHGSFHHAHQAYRLTGTRCKKRGCSGTIKRLIIGGRSAHFCDRHQTLYT